MVTNRDDFVIAIRSAFLKKGNKQRFSLIVLIFLSRLNFTPINYIKISINEIIYRVSFVASIPEQQLKKSIITIKNHIKVYENYNLIKEKIRKLEGEKFNTSFIISENKRLRKLIDEYIDKDNNCTDKIFIDNSY